MTTRYLAPLAVLALLSGCGLAETTTTAAAIAETEAQQAKAALETQAKIEQRLQEAQQMAADQRKAAEASTE
jgi:hypothetical protein